MKLARMLSAPMFVKATKYPTINSSNNLTKIISAVDAVKKSVEDTKEWNKNHSKKMKQDTIARKIKT